MPEATDIREWARQKGHDIGDRGRVPKHIVDQYAVEHPDELVDTGAEFDVALPSDLDTGETRPFAAASPSGSSTPSLSGTRTAPPSSDGETKPKPGKPRRFWQKADTGDKPKATHKRVPLEAWAGRAWKGLAYIAGAGATPTSRCLNMQAPVAGIIVDDMIKGTAIDRMAQPLARWGEGGRSIGALVGLPLLVAATERSPGLYQWTRPLMAEAATEWVLIAGPAMRKARARAAQLVKELEEFEVDEETIDGLFDHPAENPVIVKMLDAIFAPMMVHAEPEREPAAA